jgi:hypothetical protein
MGDRDAFHAAPFDMGMFITQMPENASRFMLHGVKAAPGK